MDADVDEGLLPSKVSSSFGCSLCDLRQRGDDDDCCCDDSQDDHRDQVVESPTRTTPGLLFELAAIHSTILKLEQRADLVGALEVKVASLEADLAAAKCREATATAEVVSLKRDLAALRDGGDGSKRPRLISFDAASSASSNDSSATSAE
mmetsp:Transcript_5434/g.13970  ORF Transcript_5434/g.13970 Transcript_5434/m.13970 type:complete len:150 (-) Transcript_5434:304-753(-)